MSDDGGTDVRSGAESPGRFPDSMFEAPALPARRVARLKYRAIEVAAAILFLGIYLMVLTRGRIVGW